VFLLTASLGFGALLALYFVVPTPNAPVRHRDTQSHLDQLGGVLCDKHLLRLDLGVFLLHAMMTACFVVIPIALLEAGVAADQQWKTYLPAVLIAACILVPLMGLAEGRGLAREIFLACVAALAVVQLAFGYAQGALQLMLVIADAGYRSVFRVFQRIRGDVAILGVEDGTRRSQGHGDGRLLFLAVFRCICRRHGGRCTLR